MNDYEIYCLAGKDSVGVDVVRADSFEVAGGMIVFLACSTTLGNMEAVAAYNANIVAKITCKHAQKPHAPTPRAKRHRFIGA